MASTPAINAEAPTRLLRDRVRRVFRYLPKSLAGNEEALHQLRVWGRRLRVGLPVLARKPEGKRVRRALRILRQMTRTAGASRDHDVMAGLLEVRLKALPAQSPALRVLRRRLLEARGRSRRRMANGLLDLEIATLRRDLRRAVARRGDALFTVLLRLRQARDSEGEEASTALLRLQDAFEPDALHRLRIVVRRLRYLAEVLDVLRGQPSEAPACCRQLQDLLGSIHDHHMLAVWAAAQATRAAARGQEDLRAEAAALEAHFRERSREEHRALLAAQPRELLDRALDSMGRSRGAA